MYMTEDEEYTGNMDSPIDEDYILSNDDDLETESDDYQHGYMNYLSAQQKQYSLRSRDVPVNPIQKRKEAQSKNDLQKKGNEPVDQNHSNINQPSTSSTAIEKDTQKKEIVTRNLNLRRDIVVKEVDKVTTFNLENEIAKLKVSIPLT